MIKALLFIFTCCLLSRQLVSQQSKIDSLYHLIKTAKEDTNKVIILNVLSDEIKNDKPKEGVLLSTLAINLSTKLNYKRGINISTIRLGNATSLSGKKRKH